MLSNKGHPGLVKVGFSTKDPERRAKELGGTGQPHPFVVDYEVHIDEPHAIEQAVHKLLRQFREQKQKEFFRCAPEVAVAAIRNIVGASHYYEKFQRADRKKVEEVTRLREEGLASERRKVATETEKKKEEVERQRRRNDELNLRRKEIEFRYESLIQKSDSQEPSGAGIWLFFIFSAAVFFIVRATPSAQWLGVFPSIFALVIVVQYLRADSRKKAARETLVKERDAELVALEGLNKSQQRQQSEAQTKKKWTYDKKSAILRNEQSGTEYGPSRYRRVKQGVTGFEIADSIDCWAGDLEITFRGD